MSPKTIVVSLPESHQSIEAIGGWVLDASYKEG